MGIKEDNEAWPWHAMGELADRLYAQLQEGVRDLMKTAGEPSDNPLQFSTRVNQVAYSIKSRAEKAADASYGHG